jgi:subtilisin family serine protease
LARSRFRPRPAAGTPPPPSTPAVPGPASPAETTGRYLVLLRDDGLDEGVAALRSASGLRHVASAADYAAGAIDMEEAGESDAIVLDKLKVAVVKADPSQAGALRAASANDGAILAVEPEQILHHCALVPPTGPAAWQPDYLRGYRDAVVHIYERLTGEAEGVVGGEAAAAVFNDNAQATWGLQATRVIESHFSGRGVRVAVLDTGLDLQHPDFAGRSIVSQSFIDGQDVQDGNGHGTHTTGTACGSLLGSSRRYGCAYRADIFMGKVLSNQGSGADGGILAGINWALTNGCRLVSMSLGAPVQPGDSFSPVYENVARRALAANLLIVAAAGNESQRPGFIAPVGRPANCPSIMAVAAVDNHLGIAPFSCGGINLDGGGVDIAGPGVNVFSSWPMPTRTRSISGTSMATPHVSGIAALWLEARGLNTTAAALWQLLVSNARRLSLPARDVGSGLVQAPL